MNEFSQVHSIPDGWEQVEYTYEVVPWLDISRMAVYLVTFAALFVLARQFAVLIF